MDIYEDLKNRQLQAAMMVEAQGYEPDNIMVTYSPEEYAKMHQIVPEEPYILSEETIDSFPISLLGSTEPLIGHDMSVDAFSGYNNIIEIYIEAVKKAIARSDSDEYTAEQIEAEISIQRTFDETLKAARVYYQGEYDSDLEIHNTTTNYMARNELSGDLRATAGIINRIDATIKRNESFGIYLTELLTQSRGTR